MKKKKILYVITRAEHGGAQAHVLQLLKGFSGLYEMHLAVGEEGFLTEEARRFGVRVSVIRDLVQPISPLHDMRGLREIRSLIRRVRPDLVHLHSSKAGLLGRLAAWKERTPAIFTAHGWAFTEGVSWKRKLIAVPAERLAGRFAAMIITVSNYDKELAVRHKIVSPDKVRVIWNGIEDTSQQAVHENSKSTVRIVMVARFAPPKDQLLLLEALRGVRGHGWELILIGDGPARRYAVERARDLGIIERVKFLGSREPEDVQRILSVVDIFTLVSRWEGLPLVVLEGMRAALPVVASDVGGVGEAVDDGRTGFLVPPGDVGELRRKIGILMENAKLRKTFGQEGRRRYEKFFTAEKMLKETSRVYEEVFARFPVA